MSKFENKKAFTLAELLIVVAIIGVLVAISIPVFTNQLRKARLATNKANGRSAYAAALAWYIDNANESIDQTYKDGGFYDVSTGIFTPGALPGTGKSGSATIDNVDFSNWTVDTPVKNKTAKNCLGDTVFYKWDIEWNQEPFDGTIKNITGHNQGS